MELCVDLNEITRIPYHELETVYFSVNFTVLPDGKRFLTGPSFGKKSIKFRPHCFKFTINDIQNSHFSLTIFSHLTDNRTFILSYLKIPLITVPVNGFARKSFETMLTHSISSLSPIVTLTIGINIDYRFEKFFEHPSIIDKIEYDKFESPPKIELDVFGKLIPPKNYIDKCSNLVEKDSEIFLKLISNDSLRKYVLDKAAEYLKKNEDISSLFKDQEKKKEDKISNQSHDYGISVKDKFNFFPKGIDSETKKVKFKKDSENKIADHSPQPPVEPKSYYQSIAKNKSKISNELMNKDDNNSQQSSNDDDNQSKAYVRQFSLNPKIRTKPKTPSKSLTINRADVDPSSSQSFQKVDSPSLLTTKSQFVQQQQQQQQPKFLPQTKVPQQPQQLQLQQKLQQIQPQQSIKIQPQSSQQKLRQQFQQSQQQQQQLQLQLPSNSRPQQPQSPFYQTQPPSPHHPPQTQSPFHQIQTQTPTAEIGIHKMISKKKVNESEIGIQKILQQKNNLDSDKNQGRKQMKRSIVQNQKPNPPQIQLPIASLPTSVENSGNPRRARQNP